MIVTDELLRTHEMRRNGEIHSKAVAAAREDILAVARAHDRDAFARACLEIAAAWFGVKAVREGGECLLEDRCLAAFTKGFRACMPTGYDGELPTVESHGGPELVTALNDGQVSSADADLIALHPQHLQERLVEDEVLRRIVLRGLRKGVRPNAR